MTGDYTVLGGTTVCSCVATQAQKLSPSVHKHMSTHTFLLYSKRHPVVEYFTLASWPSVSGSVSKALVIGKSSELCGCVGFGLGCGLFGLNGLGFLRNIPLDTVILGSSFDQLRAVSSLLV